MKFLSVFAAILAVAFGAKAPWTLDQLSEALQSPHTNPSLMPILEQALNSYMEALIAGESHNSISIATAPVDLSTWTLQDLSAAVESPNTNPAILPYLENALNGLMSAIINGEVQPTTAQVAIQIPALEVSYWTLAELEQALANPSINPAMVPYLEQGLNHIVQNLFNGIQQTSIVLAIPTDATKPVPVVPVVPEPVVAPEVDPVQVVDHNIEAPVTPVINPAPGAPSPVTGSPLVQIILNINQQSVTPGAVIAPTPVVVDNGEVFPNPRPPVPVNPRPPAPVNPRPPVPEVEVDPVIVAPEVNPIEVIAVSPPEVNPIEVIAVSPPEVNPIEVIAVSPPEVNPIEVIAVSPPEVNPIEVIAVSPPEVNPIEVIAVSPPEVNPIEVIAVSPPEVNPIEVIAVSPPEINPIEAIAVSPPEINPVVPEVVGGGDIGPM